jgi:hypothetical protein
VVVAVGAFQYWGSLKSTQAVWRQVEQQLTAHPNNSQVFSFRKYWLVLSLLLPSIITQYQAKCYDDYKNCKSLHFTNDEEK